MGNTRIEHLQVVYGLQPVLDILLTSAHLVPLALSARGTSGGSGCDLFYFNNSQKLQCDMEVSAINKVQHFVPKAKLYLGKHAFSIATPKTWNNLPSS